MWWGGRGRDILPVDGRSCRISGGAEAAASCFCCWGRLIPCLMYVSPYADRCFSFLFVPRNGTVKTQRLLSSIFAVTNLRPTSGILASLWKPNKTHMAANSWMVSGPN